MSRMKCMDCGQEHQCKGRSQDDGHFGMYQCNTCLGWFRGAHMCVGAPYVTGTDQTHMQTSVQGPYA